ncbi:MAG TPA: PQQ-binding-like beta-propeller repeat protein [Bryobacteraceae bacterium]|jgi:outer membrane protein assembly factor BamB
MTIAQTEEPTPRKLLRVWPGVVAVVLQWLVRFGLPKVAPAAFMFAILGELVGAFAIVVWWAFFSRARWFERVGALVLMIAGLAATRPILDPSVLLAGMGMLFFIYAIPVLSLAFVAWAVVTRRLSDGFRRVTMVATILLACGGWALLRTSGVTGDFNSEFAWRWTPTPEERLLAHANDKPAALASTPAAAKTGADWPGFRGPGRDGVIPGVRIETNWSQSPPVELWRRPVGPGWSSFAVRGDLLYTQEQRGSDEVVACYNLTTGKPVWRHGDATRFWESNGGAGPRATPTLANGRVYTFGATGILNALDAGSGAVVWSRNAASDTHTKVPGWGFASSPLVVDDVVIVAAGGKLAAYDLATGKPRWSGADGGDSYSSPQLLTIDGVAQVLLMSGHGVTSVAPADGAELWQYPWKSDTRILQPALTSDGNLLMMALTAGGGTGFRRIAVTHGTGGWTTEERWTSLALKPYFNDFVVHNGHAYGFDGGILACVDLKDGTRKWKGGRYGYGQLVLLPDQNLLLVLSEEGELALVGATTDKFTELARFPAIEGKTWNHPALVNNVLLVRNSQEMAAFRLSLARR